IPFRNGVDVSIEVPPAPAPAYRRRLGAALCALPLALALTACGSGGGEAGEDAAPTRAFTSDHSEEDVQIPEKPERIVALGWAVTGLVPVEDANLVGVSRGTQDSRMTPDEQQIVEEMPQVGTDTEINIEEVAALEPDPIVSGIP